MDQFGHSSYRKIKQRSTAQNQQNQQQQQQQQIRIAFNNHNNHHHDSYRPRSWFSQSPANSNYQNRDRNRDLNDQPTVKILAKSSKNTPTINILNKNSSNSTNNDQNENNQLSGGNTPVKTSVLTKTRPSVAILEKNIHNVLNLGPNIKTIPDRRIESLPQCIKLIDFEFNFIQQESSLIDSLLMPDPSGIIPNTGPNQIPSSIPSAVPSTSGINQLSSQNFCIVAAVGLDGCGKSSLLNTIAQCDVFQTRRSFFEKKKNLETPLSHVTNGIDLHITSERVFLLDTQPLFSASVLDELIRINSERIPVSSSGMATGSKHFYNSLMSTPIFSQVVGFDIAETENFAFIYSLQMLTFLLTICDHVILVIDSMTLDAHLFKLLSTALMMVGDAVISKANIIVYLKTTTKPENLDEKRNRNLCSQNEKRLESMFKQTLQILLGPNVNFDFINNDESLLTTTVMRPANSRSLINDQSCPTMISYHSERMWFQSIQRFWDTSIHKSSLFSDYARYLP